MKAVIMAGGEGTRLRPLTSNQPKPLIPLVNRPMMEHVVHLLKEHGFDEVVVTLAFLPQTIRTYFGDGSEFGVRMVYATEETPLGTAGSVRNARAQLDEPFLVISGDVLTDIDLSALVAFHKAKGAMATIALKAMENPLEFGIVITREDGSIERFLEKPTWGQVFSDTVNTGIYVLEPEVFDYIPEGKSVDFSSDVFPHLLEDGKSLFGFVAEGYWEDVGTLEAYHKAHQDVLDRKVAIDIPGFHMAKGVWLGEGAEIDPAASIEGPAVIGDYCRVEAGANIREYTVLGANVMVRADTFLERAVVHDNAYLSQGVRLRGSVVGRSCDLRAHARCEEGVVLGDNCFVGEHAVINSGVKVYPFKTVEPNAIINSSIVWESRGTRSLFGQHGVSGLANVDVTPELACRVAMAYATTMKKGSTVTTSRDSSRAARALKRAVMAGLNSAGINVDDLEMATVPVSRFQVRIQRSQGGITVRLTPGDPQSVTIRFFTADGTDIDEGAQRKIERIFFRQDFRRAFAADIGDIGYPPRALEYYSAALMETVHADVIRANGYQLVMDYAFGPTSLVMANVFSKLGADVLSVNPYTSTAGAAAFDAKVHASRVSDLVRSSGAHLGAVLDPDGERIILVDDEGHILTDEQALLAMVTLVATEKTKIALPVSVTSAAERIATDAGAEVVWTKVSTSSLMDTASSGGIALAASQDGGFIFPDFLPAFDATAALVKLLELLARSELRLSKVVSGLPRVHVARESVVTPWEQKGLVMRRVVEQAKDRQVVLVDGVKVIEGDGAWALVLPDPDEPVTHVWAEGSSATESRALAQSYARTIRQILR
ncbi:MAG: mannose-phosphate guanylyltransferase / phosphomannomutase [Actinomycetota bacterium]|jgi:mannose-1-phosphate guanylyltransferase/phosphomannomutase|nr:mannose-phosphate guanylyltransferase / phosphomannomutase [Actinomycetota bacterium]